MAETSWEESDPTIVGGTGAQSKSIIVILADSSKNWLNKKAQEVKNPTYLAAFKY